MASASATIPVGYKQTEVGVIPKDWDIKTLGEIGEITGAGVDKKSNPGEQPVRLVNYVDVYNRRPITSNLLSHWVTAPATKANRCSVRRGDVFFTPTSEVREDIAVSSMALEDIPDAVYSYHLVRLRCNDEIEVTYRAHAFTAKYFLDQASVLADGSGTRYVVNLPNFRRMLVALPPRDEQRRIGTMVTDIETQIAKLTELIRKKSSIKQGTMQRLLTGKVRLPGFTGEWVEKTLEDITICLDNLRIPLNEKQRNDMKGNYPYCGANGVVDFIDQYAIDDDIILMAEDGGYFDQYAVRPIAYRITGKCWVNNHAHILKSRTGYDQGFIFYSLVHKNILRYIASGTRAKLNKSEMNKIEVFLPKEKLEQEAIAEVLSDMDAEITALEQRLEKAKAIKQGMMQQLLTGRIRLVDPSTPVEASA
jgi:type I restriction enzyme S subunit